MQSDRPARLEIKFSGHVQGVGFRFSTQRIARQFEVHGFVRNLANGQVELVLEGLPAEIRACLRQVQTEMAGYIQRAQEIEADARGEFSCFEIRH